jgi:hypothetical protein
MTKSLGQAYSIQTFDQQLYAIAKQVEWAKQDTFKTHILLTVDMSLGFASTNGAYDTTEYSGLYSERELLYPVQNGIT